MSAFKQAATVVLIGWHSYCIWYLQLVMRVQMTGRGWADKDADDSLKAHQVGLQLAWSDFIAHGARK